MFHFINSLRTPISHEFGTFVSSESSVVWVCVDKSSWKLLLDFVVKTIWLKTKMFWFCLSRTLASILVQTDDRWRSTIKLYAETSSGNQTVPHLVSRDSDSSPFTALSAKCENMFTVMNTSLPKKHTRWKCPQTWHSSGSNWWTKGEENAKSIFLSWKLGSLFG